MREPLAALPDLQQNTGTGKNDTTHSNTLLMKNTNKGLIIFILAYIAGMLCWGFGVNTFFYWLGFSFSIICGCLAGSIKN